MPRILRNLKIHEVSSVDKGAGRGVKVMLMKRADDPVLDVRGIIKPKHKREPDMTPEQIAEMIKKSVESATANFATEIAKRDMEILVLKMSPDEQSHCKDMDDAGKKSFMAMKPEDRAAKMKKAEDPDTVLDAKIAKVVAPIVTENADLKKRLAIYEDERDQEAFRKRAVAAGLKPEDGELMRKAYGGDIKAQGELDKRITEIVKSANEIAKTAGVFREFGSNHQGSGDTPTAKMWALADELRKTEKCLTREQAFAKVSTDPANTDLWQEIRKAEKAASGITT